MRELGYGVYIALENCGQVWSQLLCFRLHYVQLLMLVISSVSHLIGAWVGSQGKYTTDWSREYPSHCVFLSQDKKSKRGPLPKGDFVKCLFFSIQHHQQMWSELCPYPLNLTPTQHAFMISEHYHCDGNRKVRGIPLIEEVQMSFSVAGKMMGH